MGIGQHLVPRIRFISYLAGAADDDGDLAGFGIYLDALAAGGPRSAHCSSKLALTKAARTTRTDFCFAFAHI